MTTDVSDFGEGQRQEAMRFEVIVQVMPSQGGQERKLPVEASSEVEAIVQATLKLDNEGITRWSLKRVVPVTS